MRDLKLNEMFQINGGIVTVDLSNNNVNVALTSDSDSLILGMNHNNDIYWISNAWINGDKVCSFSHNSSSSYLNVEPYSGICKVSFDIPVCP